ncbi:hypothetical protein M422DRAFT_270739 [Sphaerobolus stellatus SS14]|uniref:Uncharacterized protein n=1 Tax=Sphaerobolus stellatus (strain SS14) TaxID=990650 RepID=A0A0C9US60_SPHS4|nr:hypothetical protein M422DRAFT_270739 [Sphaerobolus stellatus SS14]
MVCYSFYVVIRGVYSGVCSENDIARKVMCSIPNQKLECLKRRADAINFFKDEVMLGKIAQIIPYA